MDFYRIATPEGERSTVTLYHGTVLAYAKNIISEGIKTRYNENKELDFGGGFYFADRRIAERLAKKKARDNKSYGLTDESIQPTLLPLEVDLDYILKTESVLIFKKKDLKWLNFIFETRDNMTIPYGHEAAIIIGPMADGDVERVIPIYHRHRNAFTKFYACINFMFFSGFGHMQYVVKKQYLCDNGHIKVGLPIIIERRPSYDQ